MSTEFSHVHRNQSFERRFTDLSFCYRCFVSSGCCMSSGDMSVFCFTSMEDTALLFFFSGAVVHDLNMYVWQNNIKILMLSFGQEGSSIKNWGLLFLIALLALTSCWDSLRDAWFLTLQMTPNQKTSALTPLAHEIRSGLRPLPGGSLLQCSIFASSICFQASSLSEKTAWP